MAAVKSKDVVVDFSSDRPEFAQGHIEAMYLYDTGHDEVLPYLEQDHGRKPCILDVTDPGGAGLDMLTLGPQRVNDFPGGGRPA